MSHSVNPTPKECVSEAMNDSVTDSPPSRAPADQGAGNRELGSMDQGVNYSPSTPPSSTSTRDTETLDGWTIRVLLALADYLDRAGQALTSVPGHLRWLADGRTDLVAVLGLEVQPLDSGTGSVPVVRPVVVAGARSAEEIRADLARRARGGLGEVHAYVRRLVGDVEPLLAEREQAFAELRLVRARAFDVSAEYRAREASQDRIRERLTVERDEAGAKVRAVEMLHVWTNEDGRRFVFADDLATALGTPS